MNGDLNQVITGRIRAKEFPLDKKLDALQWTVPQRLKTRIEVSNQVGDEIQARNGFEKVVIICKETGREGRRIDEENDSR